MIWLVWDSEGTEVDARRIDGYDCVSVAEEWARREGAEDPACIEHHLGRGLDLRCRAANGGTIYRVRVEAKEE